MKIFKKVLFSKLAESPLAWRTDRKAKTHITPAYECKKEGVENE